MGILTSRDVSARTLSARMNGQLGVNTAKQLDEAVVHVCFSSRRILSFLRVGKAWETGSGYPLFYAVAVKVFVYFYMALMRHESTHWNDTVTLKVICHRL